MEVTPINGKAVTPRILLENIATQAEDLDELYVVAIKKSGETVIGCVGPLKGMCFAAAVLNESVMREGRMTNLTSELER